MTKTNCSTETQQLRVHPSLENDTAEITSHEIVFAGQLSEAMANLLLECNRFKNSIGLDIASERTKESLYHCPGMVHRAMQLIAEDVETELNRIRDAVQRNPN